MRSKDLKLIGVKRDNYARLKNMGKMGDTFDDIISKILNENQNSLQYSEVGTKDIARRVTTQVPSGVDAVKC
jgi:predicted CopG family antitoxin